MFYYLLKILNIKKYNKLNFIIYENHIFSKNILYKQK